MREFYPALLVARGDAGGGMTRFAIEPAVEAWASTHVAPGQYVEVRANGETGYFVLASDPGARRIELVMRSGGGASDVLLGMQSGAAVEVSGALGPGFPVESARGRPLVVVLGGTGVAAGRPLVRPRIAAGDAGRTLVVVGARTGAELATGEDLDAWACAGVRVLVSILQPQPQPQPQRSSWLRFAEGYVQDALVAVAEATAIAKERSFPVRGALVFAVGADSMVEALRRAAPSLGIAPEDIKTNY